jgi:hypothetical protein
VTTKNTRIKGRQLEHRPVAVIAALVGRAVEIADVIEDQAGHGDSPVREVEAKQHLLPPAPARCGRQLDHRPAAVRLATAPSAAIVRRAVEIAGGIEDQAGVGQKPVRAVEVEAMQDSGKIISIPSRGRLWRWARPLSIAAAGVAQSGTHGSKADNLPNGLNSEGAVKLSSLHMTVPEDEALLAIQLLIEGASVRTVERVTQLHRDTILRLLVLAGERCIALMDTRMRNLQCKRIQADEIWSFAGKKDRNLKVDDPEEFGNAWMFVAMDADTKLIPSYVVSKRETTYAFLTDLRDRMRLCSGHRGWLPGKTLSEKP